MTLGGLPRWCQENAPEDVIVKGAERFLDDGADINGTDSTERTALHVAARRDMPGLCDLLLKYGADIHASDIVGFTPLHEAALHSKAVCLQLIAAGADVNADVEGYNYWFSSPLYQASSVGNKEICHILLRAGGDPTAIMARAHLFLSDYDNSASDDPTHNSLVTVHAIFKETEAHFNKAKNDGFPRSAYFKTAENGKEELLPGVLDACAFRLFHDQIAMPLIQSGNAEALKLAQKMYKALPRLWQDANRATEVQLSRASGRGALDSILRANPSESRADKVEEIAAKGSAIQGGRS